MSTLLYDLRFAWRRLRRSPGFSVVVILTLALGIGATTAVFTVVRGVLLRAMPFEAPDRLVRIFTTTPTGEAVNALSAPNFMSLQEQNHAFTEAVSEIGAPAASAAGWWWPRLH